MTLPWYLWWRAAETNSEFSAQSSRKPYSMEEETLCWNNLLDMSGWLKAMYGASLLLMPLSVDSSVQDSSILREKCQRWCYWKWKWASPWRADLIILLTEFPLLKYVSKKKVLPESRKLKIAINLHFPDAQRCRSRHRHKKCRFYLQKYFSYQFLMKTNIADDICEPARLCNFHERYHWKKMRRLVLQD